MSQIRTLEVWPNEIYTLHIWAFVFQNDKQTRLLQLTFSTKGENDENFAEWKALSMLSAEWKMTFKDEFWGYKNIILQTAKWFTFNKEQK